MNDSQLVIGPLTRAHPKTLFIVPRHHWKQLAGIGLFVVLIFGGVLRLNAQEVAIAADDFKKLDTFEGHTLAKADQAFAKKDYRSAGAAYEAFLLQYPKSVATPYAILRKGRCQHFDNKRFEAIKTYTEVLDYFPNAITYAAAALYYIGACHAENGNVEQAIKAWAELARDVDYRKHHLAAGALTRLADNLVKLGKPADAVGYYQQAAVDFRRSNPDIAREAISKVLLHFIRTQPDQTKLRDFYDKVGTFERDPGTPDDKNYWQRVRENIAYLGNFTDAEAKDRDRFYQYWAGAMEGKNPDWDDFQVDLARYKRVYENDLTKWMDRLDKQFKAYQKDGDYNRIVKWIALYAQHKTKVQEYYGKLDFAKMNNAQIQYLMRVLFENVQDSPMAVNVFSKLHFDQMTDAAKLELARYLWDRDESCVVTAYQNVSDKDNGRMGLLNYYVYRRNPSKGLPLAEQALQSPQTAKTAYWLKAQLLEMAGKYPEAIQAYQAADNPPQNLWRIVHCFLAQKKRDQAIAQLREIENFFQSDAAEAALKIASLFRDDRKQYVSLLRGVLKKYPKSSQSSTAHQELEAMGVNIGGGVDAE